MGSVIELPNGIQVGEEWVKEVELDEISGEEEDLLFDTTKKGDGTGKFAKSGPRRITEILSACTLKIGGKERTGSRWDNPRFFEKEWREANTNDRIFALLALRRITLGDIVRFTATCPDTSCRKTMSNCVVNLSELEVDMRPLSAMGVPRTATFPRCGKKFTWTMIMGETGEDAVTQVMRQSKDRYMSLMINLRILSIEGVEPHEKLKYVMRLSSFDRQFARDLFNEAEGGVKTSVDVVCDECGVEFPHRLEVMSASFFAPSGSANTRSST